jgi:3'(2'), 5'-bisphosphate nucleotidase
LTGKHADKAIRFPKPVGFSSIFDSSLKLFLPMNQLLATSIDAALAAGKAIMAIYDDPKSDFEVELKSDSSPLTVADRRSHEVIMSYLETTPYPILSEEGKATPYSVRKSWRTLWIVDPLDGTKEFIKRNGEFTVNIALVSQGSPVLGVIYVPVTGMLYYGAQGVGSFRVRADGQPDAASLMDDADKLPIRLSSDRLRVVASRSHMNADTQTFIDSLRSIHSNVELVTSGSSLKICRIAEGSAHIYPRFAPTMEWDTAAGHAIALFAGKNLYKDDSSDQLEYNKPDLLNPWFIAR